MGQSQRGEGGIDRQCIRNEKEKGIKKGGPRCLVEISNEVNLILCVGGGAAD